MKSRPARSFLLVFVLLALCIGGYVLYDRGRPAPVPVKEELYEGVTYRRVVRFLPHPLIAHVLTIDTKAKGIEFLVTPPDASGEQPLKARTTSQFLEEFGLQIAINGDNFGPWWSRGPADYYPHVGDPVAPFGFAASKGRVYAIDNIEEVGIRPTLYINRRNVLSFNNQPNRIHHAISGERMIVLKGEVVPDLDDRELDPRTAAGINRNGRYLYIVVVDGRQPFYSEGATFVDLAELMIEQGAFMAMNMDGGGSSTMVIEGENGEPRILNSPVDSMIPGRERPVGNHLGIFVK
ncbi:MAG TPA: phosphodiester glycosidase family protein [Anaerolineales bacterium]|nr:phosphodiester glycosidase family protein [Anaerolineales bacterium]